MMRLRLRVMISGFNQAVAEYTLARLELSSSHPRMAPPPVVDRLGALEHPGDPGRSWRSAIRQVRVADTYVRSGASAVARRDPAWSRLTAAFSALRLYAAGIEVLRVSGARVRRKPAP